jgi:hypothetical protein
MIALRDDNHYEFRIERWYCHADPISGRGYWSEIARPSLADSLALGRQLGIDQECKNKG